MKTRRLYDRRGRRVSGTYVMAAHEAGHVVGALELGFPVEHVTLVDAHGDGGGGEAMVVHPVWLATYLARGRPPRVQRDEARRSIVENCLVHTLAGRVAERLLLRGGRAPHHFWSGATPTCDAGQATVCARLLGARGANIRAVVESFVPRTRKLLESRWDAVIALANELEDRLAMATISGDVAQRIASGERVAEFRLRPSRRGGGRFLSLPDVAR